MKRLLSIVVLMLLAVGAWAQQISEQQARERALQFLASSSTAKSRGVNVVDKQTTTAKVGAKSIYAFNLDGGGYVIASGDSRSLPVLGYSATGTIDWDNMPDNMRAWLKQYDKAIATLGDTKEFVDGNSTLRAKTRGDRAAIKPILKTHWDQTSPYWNKVPLYEGANPDWQGQKSPTGCVATAMAMIMNYYQWPKAACEPIPAYSITTAYENEEKEWKIDALPATTFDWDNMLDEYYVNRKLKANEAQQDAVATLMRYCGQSVMMYYSPEFSGSDHQQVVEALVKYFGYKNTVRATKRITCTIDEWEDLIYSELAKGKPVQYGGETEESGHSFVCDGYDGNGFFHINWGWGGGCDDYYSLSVLNPYNNTSAGASSSGIGFSMGQDAIIGIEPDTDGTSSKQIIPQAYLYDEEPVTVLAPDTVEFRYPFISFSYEEDEVRLDYAMGTMDADGKLTPLFIGDKSDSIVYNQQQNYHQVIIDSTAFDPGQKLRLYPMVKFRSIPGADWQLLGSPEFNVMAGRLETGQFFLYRDIPDLEITEIEVTRGLGRIGMRNDLTVTVHNASNFESTVPLYLVPYYLGDVDIDKISDYIENASQGDPMIVGAYLRAAEDTKITYCFKPLNSGLVYLQLCKADGTMLADHMIEVSDIVGSYDDYLVNESNVTMSDVYVGDYETEVPSDTDMQLGHAVYHVSIADNTEANIPDARPDESVYFYARFADADGENMTEVRLEKEAIDYLTGLPANAGDGNYKLTCDLDYDIRRGGNYYVWSYFNQWLSEDHKDDNCIASAEQYQSFVIADEPSIRVAGETSLASGEPLNIEIHLNTGFPYDQDLYAGDKQMTYSLYFVKADGTEVDMGTQSVPISFESGTKNLAGVDTVTIKGTLSDGEYIIRVSTDIASFPTRDIKISVGGTGIAAVKCDDAQSDAYTDLRGVRMNSRPLRKGIYIRNGRKVILK